MADTLIELQNNPQAAEMPHADWLGLLIDREVTFRDNRRLSRRLAAAKLRQAATVEDVDYRTARGLDRALFQSLATSQWVREHNHLAIIGPTGTGKSWPKVTCAKTAWEKSAKSASMGGPPGMIAASEELPKLNYGHLKLSFLITNI